MADFTLEVRGLTVRYDAKIAVDDVTLELRPGSFVGLIGPNGAGKSSLMRAMAGIVPPVAGQVTSGAIDVLEQPEKARGRIGWLPQDVALFDDLSAEETLLLAGRLRGLQGDALKREVLRWLKLTGLHEARGALARYYSGGMRRKLALGATMIGDPPVILLDESFAGLDPEATATIEDELRRHRQRGASILLSTHRLEILERLADRVILLQNGRVTQELTRAGIDEILDGPSRGLVAWYLERMRGRQQDVPESPAAAGVPAGASPTSESDARAEAGTGR